MALKDLFSWSGKGEETASSACGTACGAGDAPAEPSSACGCLLYTSPSPRD